MARLASLEFEALSPIGDNYLNWKVDATLALKAQNLHDHIVQKDKTESGDTAKALMLLRRHIHPDLKNEYLTVACPAELWTQLADRFHHLELITLPVAREEFRTLRFQDFKTVAEYNAKLLSITSRLTLCNEPVSDITKIDKTLSTFHAENILLQQQYRGLKFTSYNELMQVLYMAEKQNHLLMQNHLSRPTGSTPLPETNHSAFRTMKGNSSGGRGRGRGKAQNGGRGNQGRGSQGKNKNGTSNGNKLGPKRNASKKSRNPEDKAKNECFLCGKSGHWSRTCKASKETKEAYKSRKAESHHLTWTPAEPLHGSKEPMYPFMDFDNCDDLEDDVNVTGSGGKASKMP